MIALSFLSGSCGVKRRGLDVPFSSSFLPNIVEEAQAMLEYHQNREVSNRLKLN